LLFLSRVISRILGETGKKLDARAKNNQLGWLVSKRAAGLPLYLTIACEELRVFGSFEGLSSRVQKMGGTVFGIVKEMIVRLERDHGTVCTE
jgi:telomerase protein component 1